jgi:hypothetical protein
MSKRFNILSLSGGGYLGLYTISVLAALEQEFSGRESDEGQSSDIQDAASSGFPN